MPLVWKYKDKRTGIWRLEYDRRFGGRKISTRTRDEKAAELIRSKKDNELLLGQHGIIARPLRKTRFSEFSSLFLSQKQLDGRKPNSLIAYRASLNEFGQSVGIDELLHKLTALHAREFIERRQSSANGKPAKLPKTIRNDIVNLRSAFKWAIEQGFTHENPFTAMVLPKRGRRVPRYYSDEAYFKLMEAIEADDNAEFKDIVNAYLLTGCRRGELRDLAYEELIDFKSRILIVPQAKEEDDKIVPFEGELEEILHRLVNLAKSRGQKRLVKWSEDTLTDWFSYYRDQAGLPKKLTLHALRHTFGTWLAMKGTPTRVIQGLLGHRDAQSTQIYTHLASAELRRAIRKIKLPVRRSKTMHPTPH